MTTISLVKTWKLIKQVPLINETFNSILLTFWHSRAFRPKAVSHSLVFLDYVAWHSLGKRVASWAYSSILRKYPWKNAFHWGLCGIMYHQLKRATDWKEILAKGWAVLFLEAQNHWLVEDWKTNFKDVYYHSIDCPGAHIHKVSWKRKTCNRKKTVGSTGQGASGVHQTSCVVFKNNDSKEQTESNLYRTKHCINVYGEQHEQTSNSTQ